MTFYLQDTPTVNCGIILHRNLTLLWNVPEDEGRIIQGLQRTADRFAQREKPSNCPGQDIVNQDVCRISGWDPKYEMRLIRTGNAPTGAVHFHCDGLSDRHSDEDGLRAYPFLTRQDGKYNDGGLFAWETIPGQWSRVHSVQIQGDNKSQTIIRTQSHG